MTPRDLQIENETLKRQLAEARAAIADRNAKIEKLAKDVATLEAAVKHLLTQRRSGYRIQEGQGLLFPESAPAGESPQADGSTPVDGAEAEAAEAAHTHGWQEYALWAAIAGAALAGLAALIRRLRSQRVGGAA